METKDTLSSCLNSDEQQIQDNAKKELHVEKVDTSTTLDASLVDTESSGTKSIEQDTSSKSENDAHADDANIITIYDEEPMAEVQLTTGQQHSEQPKFNNE
ncbi:hypothetical protein Tco_0553311 [Tanacetum coccineum]